MSDINKVASAISTERGWITTEISQRPILKSALPAGFKPLVTLAHLSDTHVCDAESPARLAFTDRYADNHYRDTPLLSAPVGNYRPQEMLTAQVLEQMIRTLNQIGSGPVFSNEIDFAVLTGDLTDNAQSNEFDWVTGLLRGSENLQTFSAKYSGPGGQVGSQYFWNPTSESDSDFPKRLFGFPTIPEFFEAISVSWKTQGLRFPYFAVHGNHDLLLQGTVPVSAELQSLATGNLLPVEFVEATSVETYDKNFSPFGPTAWPAKVEFILAEVPADPNRRVVGENEFEERFELPRKYFVHHLDGYSLIQLDTVNPHGGWDGSIDSAQLNWLLTELSTIKQPVILASHHPFNRLTNTYAPTGAPERVDGSKLVAALDDFAQVFLWLAGHEHQNIVQKIGTNSQILHIETCSLIDWPQEARIIEIAVSDEDILIASTMISHESTVGLFSADSNLNLRDASLQSLAGISRELAANDWQKTPLGTDQLNFKGAGSHRDFLIRMPKSR